MLIETKKRWKLMMNKLETSEIEILEDILYEKGNDIDHHPLVLEMQDPPIKEKSVYQMRRFLKNLSKIVREPVVDIILVSVNQEEFHFCFMCRSQWIYYIYNTNNEFNSLDFFNNFLKISNDLIKNFDNTKISTEEYRRWSTDHIFNQFWHLDVKRDDFKKIYDEYYSKEAIKKREIEKINRRNELIQINEFVSNYDYYSGLYVNNRFQMFNEDTLVYRHLLLQSINSYNLYSKPYIRYGIKNENYNAHFIDLFVYITPNESTFYLVDAESQTYFSYIRIEEASWGEFLDYANTKLFAITKVTILIKAETKGFLDFHKQKGEEQ